ncbi:MAG: mechanosensitive ion channel family protein [candidate division NC10 bacterium]|nr:mechanosensitive ion channel family protein [candidate division NC10 bacterium]
MYPYLERIGIAENWQGPLVALTILLLSWIVGKVLSWILSRLGHYLAQRSQSEVGDQMVVVLRSPLFFLCLLVGGYLAAEELDLSPRLFQTIQGTIYTLGVFLGALVLKRIFDSLMKRHAGQVAQRTGSRLYGEFSPLVDKVVTFFIFGIALIIVLSHFGYSVTSLVAALGVGSLAIALAAKDTLSNIIAGFIIMVDRPFLPGDRIEIATKEEGDVLEIGLRSTKLKTLEGTLMVVPNSQLVDSRVVNRSYPDERMACTIKVQVPCSQDLQVARTLLEQIPKEIPEVLKDPPPSAYIQELSPQDCDFLLSFWIQNSRRRREVVDQIYHRIWERFQKEGIWPGR